MVKSVQLFQKITKHFLVVHHVTQLLHGIISLTTVNHLLIYKTMSQHITEHQEEDCYVKNQFLSRIKNPILDFESKLDGA